MKVTTDSLIMAFCDLTLDDAKLVLGIINGEVDPVGHDKCPLTTKWYGLCWHKPNGTGLAMSAANEILGGYGVEAVFDDGKMWPWLSYVNVGDTYDATLCNVNGRYIISSFGNEVERHEREA